MPRSSHFCSALGLAGVVAVGVMRFGRVWPQRSAGLAMEGRGGQRMVRAISSGHGSADVGSDMVRLIELMIMATAFLTPTPWNRPFTSSARGPARRARSWRSDLRWFGSVLTLPGRPAQRMSTPSPQDGVGSGNRCRLGRRKRLARHWLNDGVKDGLRARLGR